MFEEKVTGLKHLPFSRTIPSYALKFQYSAVTDGEDGNNTVFFLRVSRWLTVNAFCSAERVGNITMKPSLNDSWGILLLQSFCTIDAKLNTIEIIGKERR